MSSNLPLNHGFCRVFHLNSGEEMGLLLHDVSIRSHLHPIMPPLLLMLKSKKSMAVFLYIYIYLSLPSNLCLYVRNHMFPWYPHVMCLGRGRGKTRPAVPCWRKATPPPELRQIPRRRPVAQRKIKSRNRCMYINSI